MARSWKASIQMEKGLKRFLRVSFPKAYARRSATERGRPRRVTLDRSLSRPFHRVNDFFLSAHPFHDRAHRVALNRFFLLPLSQAHGCRCRAALSRSRLAGEEGRRGRRSRFDELVGCPDRVKRLRKEQPVARLKRGKDGLEREGEENSFLQPNDQPPLTDAAVLYPSQTFRLDDAVVRLYR